MNLTVDEKVKPVANKHRRIPYHLRPKVEKECARLLEAGVIERVTEPTGWMSPVVITNKADGGIRMCIDMREPNKAIQRVQHVIPTVEDIRCKVNGAKIFSKIDLKNGYHQLVLGKSSRKLTAFSTHEGLFQFGRGNYGTNSLAEIFHNEVAKVIQHIRGVFSIHDDF